MTYYGLCFLLGLMFGLGIAALLAIAGRDTAQQELEAALEAEYLRGLNNGRILGRKGDV
jgi:prolipoprotein diacylglyceryltransferase